MSLFIRLIEIRPKSIKHLYMLGIVRMVIICVTIHKSEIVLEDYVLQRCTFFSVCHVTSCAIVIMC